MTRVAVAGAVVLALGVATLCLWLGVRGRTSTASPQLGPTTTASAGSVASVGPISVTAAELKERAGTLGQDVYWLGPDPGHAYELERTAAGYVFVRDTTAGTTVGTYPLASGYASTALHSRSDGWGQEHVEAWLVAYPTSSSATTVYLAAQGFPYQIEVYDPAPGHARELVESGAVTPVR